MNRSLRSPSQCARPAASSDRGAGPSSTKRPTAAVSCTQTPSAVQQTPWLSQTPDTSRCGWTTAKVGKNVSFPSVCVVTLQQIPPGQFITIRVPTLFAYCETLIWKFFFKFNQGTCPWMAFAWIFFGIFLILLGGSVGQIIYREYIVSVSYTHLTLPTRRTV